MVVDDPGRMVVQMATGKQAGALTCCSSPVQVVFNFFIMPRRGCDYSSNHASLAQKKSNHASQITVLLLFLSGGQLASIQVLYFFSLATVQY